MKEWIKYLFMHSAGYTYSNLSRLFMRLFVGIMFLQFGIRQILAFNAYAPTFPAVLGMSSTATLIAMIVIEVVCSTFIMLGFLTRISVLPAIVSMVLAEHYLLTKVVSDPTMIDYMQPGYIPIFFIGVFFYLLLSGPGKISLDYLISLHLINNNKTNDDDDTLKEA